jgi:hypothetical protein
MFEVLQRCSQPNTTTMTTRQINNELAKHNSARLEMMMLEERGIFISYKEALELIEKK